MGATPGAPDVVAEPELAVAVDGEAEDASGNETLELTGKGELLPDSSS